MSQNASTLYYSHLPSFHTLSLGLLPILFLTLFILWPMVLFDYREIISKERPIGKVDLWRSAMAREVAKIMPNMDNQAWDGEGTEVINKPLYKTSSYSKYERGVERMNKKLSWLVLTPPHFHSSCLVRPPCPLPSHNPKSSFGELPCL